MTSIDDVIRLLEAAKGTSRKAMQVQASTSKAKPKRKVSVYKKKYGAAFKKLAQKYKTKKGKWKKDGFKRCAAAARKAAKK